MKLSVVIPVYKNHAIFLKSLRHNLKFLKDCEIVIVDDDPESDLKKKLEGFDVVYFKNSRNLGFAKACNQGVKLASGKYILLLNSDVFFVKGKVQEVLKEFEKDRKLFAISFLQIDGGRKVGRNFLYWNKGFFEHKGVDDFSPGINAWAEGGACLFEKGKFLKLGGFLEIYSPFYWEDIDLSYRAWKAGFKVLFSPGLVFKHNHETTISKYFERKKILEIAYRNGFFFIWINLTDKLLLLFHILFLPVRLLTTSLKDRAFFFGFVLALKDFPRVLKERQRVQKKVMVSDAKIILRFKKEIIGK